MCSPRIARLRFVPLCLIVAGPLFAETPLGPAFSYQGHLKQAGQPMNDTIELAFSLWDAAGPQPNGGLQLGTTQTLNGVSVNNGLFTVVLNAGGEFGANAFNGQARWLQISVKGTVLTPRQPLAAAPYALAVPGIDGFSLDASDGSPVDAVYVDAVGRVGIGTTTPQTLLHLNGSNPSLRLNNTAVANRSFDLLSDALGLVLRSTSPNTDLFRFTSGTSTLELNKSAGEKTIVRGDLTAMEKFSVGVPTVAEYAVNISGDTLIKGQKLIIDSSKVGIGTSTPETTFHVKGTARANVVEITGGADIAEPFNIRGEIPVRPGMVVSIDPDRVGELRLATRAYDPTVAGVISGANGVNAGMVLRQEGSAADGQHPVALTGRVWCWCDADAGGTIEPGRLLTSSNTPGHAMSVSDHARARGAVIGKAMSRLEKGRGLVLVLVNLQ